MSIDPKEINQRRLKAMRDWIRDNCKTVVCTVTPEHCKHLEVRFNPMYFSKTIRGEIESIVSTFWAVILNVSYSDEETYNWVKIHLKEVTD